MREQINNEQLLKDSGLHIVHVRKAWNSEKNGRDITVAYRQLRNSPIVEVATSITAPCDTFERKIGTKRAIENFQAGNTFKLVNQNVEWKDTVDYLRGVFG